MQPSELLAKNPLFDTMQPEDIEALAKKFVEKTLHKGQLVFSQGDSGASMYIIRSGAVEIFLPPVADAPRVVLKDLRAGAYFGELSLFDDKPRSASVEAVEETTLLELRRDDFTDHLSTSKAATIAILSELAERLRETNAMLSQRAAKDVVKELEDNLTWGQRLADKVADLNGSWAFILAILALTVGWASSNQLLPKPFDQYPYQFYNLLLAVFVALQGPLIVMSQNRQSTKDRAQAETDFRVNLKNEVGIEALIRECASIRAELASALGSKSTGGTSKLSTTTGSA